MKSSLKKSALKAEFLEILSALHKTDFNKSKAAALLGIDRKTLHTKLSEIKEHGIELNVSSSLATN